MITGDLKNKIDNIWNIFWASGMTNPLTVIEQITYLMFIKILDENQIEIEKSDINECNNNSNLTFDENHKNWRWHIFKDFDADEMFSNMRDNVFPFIKHELNSDKDTAFAKCMKNALFLIPNERVLKRVVDALDEIDFGNKDIMGDVYEYLLSQISQSGTNGQFRTPRHIIKMMVELMKPTLNDTICDPAMGSGGFITASAQYIKENYNDELDCEKAKSHFEKTMFSGFDTDQTMIRIGAMNMMLHGVFEPNIEWMDSLSKDNQLRDTYSLILANPPFTGNIDKETIASDLIELTQTSKTELLFIALILKALKEGGRCASIVPEGVLFGSSKAHKAIRKELVENNNLLAVISMPSGVFRPYAGVSTAILIFEKNHKNTTDKVWFYDMRSDGFSLDDKRSPLNNSDIPDIINRFNNLSTELNRTRKDQSFFVSKREIIENNYNLSINKYKEIQVENIEYPPALELVEKIYDLEMDITNGIINLKKMLKEDLDFKE